MLACGLSSGAAAQAATEAQQSAAGKKWDGMTSEQEAAARDKAADKWKAMTPAQKAATKDAARSRWESMSPEEKAQAKKNLQDRHPAAAAKMAEKRKSVESATQ
jgi:hypothetical protein